MKQQILVVGGGEVFENYEDYLEFLKNFEVDLNRIKNGSWKDNLQKDLGKKYEVIYPQMPNKFNAKYNEWKIIFDKILPLLRNNLVIIGHSLGGIFLTKYLSENDLYLKIKTIILISVPFDDIGDFKLSKNLISNLNNYERIFLIHSKDDVMVNYDEVEKYKKILPKAKIITFEERGHFNQDSFPELVDLIKKQK